MKIRFQTMSEQSEDLSFPLSGTYKKLLRVHVAVHDIIFCWCAPLLLSHLHQQVEVNKSLRKQIALNRKQGSKSRRKHVGKYVINK